MSDAIGVVVVTWNNATDIADCLDAVCARSGPAVDVVVVDNSSTDATADIVARHHDVRLVRCADNTGYAAGNLTGLAELACDRMLLLNPDCVIGPTTLAALDAHLDGNPECAAAAALLTEPDGAPQFFVRPEPTLREAFWWFLTLPERWDRAHGRRRKARREQHALLSRPPDEPFDVDVPAAACVLLRRDALPEPALDPAFPLFFNDVDLYRRLRAAGWRVTVVPEARATHGHGSSHRQLPVPAKRAEQLRSLRIYARTWWPRGQAQLLDLLLAVDAVGCLVMSAARPSQRSTLRASARGSLGALGLPGGVSPWLSGRRPARALPPRPAPTPSS